MCYYVHYIGIKFFLLLLFTHKAIQLATYIDINTLLKMGSLGNSFVGVLSTITGKASEGCLILFQWVFHYSSNFCVDRKGSNLSHHLAIDQQYST